MTTKEIHQLFDVNYDKANVITAYPSFLPEEKDVWLNAAYSMWINQKYTGTNSRGVPFEGDSKRVADLEGLIRTAQLDTYTVNGFTPNELVFNLYSNKITDRYLNVAMSIKFNNDGKVREVIAVDHVNVGSFKVTSINMPWVPKPVSVEENGNILIYYDKIEIPTVTTANLQIKYIKQPAVFDYNNSPDSVFELNDNAAKEIITIAVLLALENIESQRQQSTGNIMTIKE